MNMGTLDIFQHPLNYCCNTAGEKKQNRPKKAILCNLKIFELGQFFENATVWLQITLINIKWVIFHIERETRCTTGKKWLFWGHFLVVFLNSKQLWLAWFFLYFKLLSQMTFFKINWVLDALVKHLSSKNDQKQPFLAIFWILSYVKPADFKKMQQYDYVSHLST